MVFTSQGMPGFHTGFFGIIFIPLLNPGQVVVVDMVDISSKVPATPNVALSTGSFKYSIPLRSLRGYLEAKLQAFELSPTFRSNSRRA